MNTFNRLAFHKNFWALHDVSFRIERGETFCIVAKTAAARAPCCSSSRHPAAYSRYGGGGRPCFALLELGAGFNPEFSGRDNVNLNGSILGLSTREIDERYGAFAAFAEIGDFINRPVKLIRVAWWCAWHLPWPSTWIRKYCW